jgi:CHAT domain-containing protein
VATLLRSLQFQLAKFRFGADYVRNFEALLLHDTNSHLVGLFNELIKPLQKFLKHGHLVIVPHDITHYVPFHALLDGTRYLMDDFTVSYAPSATIFAKCQQNTVHPTEGALLMGVPDSATPFIKNEVESIADVMPGANVLFGGQATVEALKTKGASCRYIHIATHGYFRQDNPLFSGIKLGDSLLSVYDLYHLKIPAELITLSGCATGLSVVGAGDELLGLVRGLMTAGAGSLMLTLWDVNDQSTSELMSAFYKRLQNSRNKAAALQEAMKETRTKYPHPYHWAPFVLVGQL